MSELLTSRKLYTIWLIGPYKETCSFAFFTTREKAEAYIPMLEKLQRSVDYTYEVDVVSEDFLEVDDHVRIDNPQRYGL
tara:strand:- start:300 stop:536 length:237 start_codon:yes stop_codon:yes gene_type:complete